MTLEDIIRYEGEQTYVDYKCEQYSKDKYAALLKDIIAMANADLPGERYIIVGVKHEPSGRKTILSIPDSEFVDDAIYQQVVRENVEPDLQFAYRPFQFEGKNLGVFTIGPELCPPYLMRKQYAQLKRGDGWIRKGTHQCLLTRSDYERIYQRRTASSDLGKKVRIGFTNRLLAAVTTPDLEMELPSRKAAERIRGVIAQKESEIQKSAYASLPAWMPPKVSLPDITLGPVPYERRSLEELRKNLKNVSEDYLEDDLYAHQEAAFELNVWVANEEDSYIMNATAFLEVPQTPGTYVVTDLQPKPHHNWLVPHIPRPHPDAERYPAVKEADGVYIISGPVGDVINHTSQRLFSVSPRLAAGPPAEGRSIEIRYRLHGENLRKPVEGPITLTCGRVLLLATS